MARKVADSHGLGDDDLIVSHGSYERLQGHLYALRGAADDIARDEPTTARELREALDWLLEFVAPVLEVDLGARTTV